MNKTNLLAIVFALVATGCTAIAADERKSGDGMMGNGMMGHGMMGNMMMGMNKMDVNGDGMLSKDEFMKSHEAMFDMMKNKDGVVDMKNMQMSCAKMMGGGNMMGGGRMMQRGMGEANK
jgi:hypothetical protein